MRVALISDLHGNEVALRAVLADARQTGFDQVICLGDTASLGPKPREVLQILRELGCVCIMGNHDEFLFNPSLLESYSEIPVIVESIDWCRDLLGEADLAFVRGFVDGTRIDLGDGAELLLFHGSPRSHMEDLLATTPPDELDRLLDGERATVLAGGHTHIQMLRQHRGMVLVNPGSVGMPFKEYASGGPPTVLSHAEYAVVSAEGGRVEVSLRRVELDRAALLGQLDGCDLPLATGLRMAYASP